MHLVVWGSILIWFVVIPVTSTETLYGSFFQYGGVAYEVLSSANFWFYLPLAAIVALLPTIVFRFVSLYRNPTFVDFVRLKEKKEGKKLFKRKKIAFKSRRHSMSRTGYAFSHSHGFAALITSGHIFGLNKDRVTEEHTRRNSRVTSGSGFPFVNPGEKKHDHSVGTSQDVTKSNVKIEVAKNTAAAAKVDAAASLSVEVHEMSPPLPTEEMEMVIRTDRDLSIHKDNAVEQTDLVVQHVSIPGLVESPDVTEDEKPEDPTELATGLGDAVGKKEDKKHLLDVVSPENVNVAMDEMTEDHAETPANLPLKVEQTDSAIVPPVSIPGLIKLPDVPKDENPENPAELATGLDDAVDKEEDKEQLLDVV